MDFDTWAESFLKKRVEKEEFDPSKHSFFTHSPLRQFIQLLFTGFLRPTYYMDAKEVFNYSLVVHDKVLKEDPDFHLAGLKIAREESFMKDQPLIGVMLRLKPDYNLREKYFNDHVEILSTYPPHHLLKKFVVPIRKKALGYGLGRHVKRLVNKVLSNYPEDLLKYYVVRYKRHMRDLINLTHFKLPDIDFARVLFNRELDKIQDEYFKAYIKCMECISRKEFVKVAEIVDEYKLPFEILRNSIPRNCYHIPEVYRALLNRATSLSVMSFVVSLAKAGVPFDILAKYVEQKGKNKNVTSLDVAKPMMVSLAEFGLDNPLTKSLGMLYTKKLVDVWKRIDTSFLKVSDKKIALILDASASMFFASLLRSFFVNSLIALAPLAINVKHLILFSEDVGEHDPQLLCSLDGICELIRIGTKKYNCGTNIPGALNYAKTLDDVDIIILSTDEQANINRLHEDEYYIIKELLKKGKGVIIHNPSPYPVHISVPFEGVSYIYGDRAESIIGSLRAQALRDLKDEEAKEVIVRLVTEKEKYRRPQKE